MMADANILLPFILRREGGFASNPADRDGAIDKDATVTTRRQVGYSKDGDGDIDVDDLKLLANEDVRGRVLAPHYWNRWKADTINDQKTADTLVDWVWASGSHGIKIPQCLLDVDVDGIVGPKTIEAANSTDPKSLFLAIYDERVKFINNIAERSVSEYGKKIDRKVTEAGLLKYTQKRFRKGWLNRLSELKNL